MKLHRYGVSTNVTFSASMRIDSRYELFVAFLVVVFGKIDNKGLKVTFEQCFKLFSNEPKF